ncbi:hypothetical protein SE91_28225 [Bradyrhizobium sp. DOA1]|nr:hypothetical protein SE91_28225 [Bradyrhizobium sp. DOA1]
MDALLAITERPPSLLTFILLTSQIHKIPISLQSRMKHIETELLDSLSAKRFITQICDRENLVFEPEALSLLIAAVPGAPRLLLRTLEKVVANGRVTEKSVKEELNLDIVGHLDSVFAAILEGNIPRQFESLEQWKEQPARKLEFIDRYLGHVYYESFLRMRRVDPVLRGLDSEVTSKLCHRILQSSERLSISASDVWQGVLECVTNSTDTSDTKLAAIVLKLNSMLAAGAAAADPTVKPPRKARKTFYNSQNARGYLSFQNARAAWNTASFMMQHYGSLFNARLVMYGENSDAVVAETSELTRQLHMRLKEWSHRSDVHFHWMWQLEGLENGFSVRMVMSINDSFIPAARDWVHSCFLRRGRKLTASDVRWRTRNAHERAIEFHWRAVRSLIRGLDPQVAVIDDTGALVPVVTLLGIPLAWQAPLAHKKRKKQRGQSYSLGPTSLKLAQAENMPFLSAVDDCAWDAADSGWELKEFRDRVLERKDRIEVSSQIERVFSDQNAFTQARMTEELSACEAKRRKLAKDRQRSWRGWWLARTRDPVPSQARTS